jgi:UDP-GlcNAc:undecaprenyl-phosphate GlcNAc-1-phosphate transferase
MTPSELLAAGALPLALAWLLTAALIRAAPRLGLIDLPSARKVHTTPTPRGGGLAVLAAVLAAAFALTILDRQYLPFLWHALLALPVAVLGLLDDLRPLPWQLRLGVQAVAAAVAVPLVAPELGMAWAAPAVLWVVGLTNAFNMLDNMDALSGGVAALTAAAVGAALVLPGPEYALGPALPYLALIAGLLGFLWFNRPPARIFLGDVGSMFLGFFLALGGLRLAPAAGGPPWRWLAPLCLFATPCYDLTAVVLLRLSQGRSPFHPDKQHLSHRLNDRGLSRPLAVGVIYLFTLASGAAGLLLYAVGSWASALLVVAQPALWWGALAVTEFASRRGPPAA